MIYSSREVVEETVLRGKEFRDPNMSPRIVIVENKDPVEFVMCLADKWKQRVRRCARDEVARNAALIVDVAKR
jgi:hypothetical protein